MLLGIAVTTGYAAYQDGPAVVPAWATAGGLIATVVIGGLAGLYPAIRAARLAPNGGARSYQMRMGWSIACGVCGGGATTSHGRG